MPELWDLADWPSPNPEAVVHARVRTRARSILRLRVAVAAVVASLAVVVGLTDVPAPGPGVKMRTDSPWAPANQPDEDTVKSGIGAPGPQDPIVDASGPEGERLPAALPRSPSESPAPARSRRAVTTVMPDLAGDAHYLADCEGGPCPPYADLDYRSQSQDAFDITSVAVPCSESSVQFRLNLANLGAEPQANRFGLKPDMAMYHFALLFDDPQRTQLSVGVHVDLEENTVWTGGVLSFGEGDQYRYIFFTPPVVQDEHGFVAQWTWPELQALFEQTSSGAAPPSAGTSMKPSAVSSAVFRPGGYSHFGQGVDTTPDAADYPYRFCD